MMNIFLPCHECNVKTMTGNKSHVRPFKTTQVQELPVYEFTCDHSHKTKVLVENPKFEHLYESGIRALRVESYREAVMNFHTALERFYEFAMIVLLYADGTDLDLDVWKTTWKNVERSEKQLGAFHMLYLGVSKTSAPAFKGKQLEEPGMSIFNGLDLTNLRNNVVHNGYYPTRNQAILYGEAVFRYCNRLLVDFYDKSKWDTIAILLAADFHLKEFKSKYEADTTLFSKEPYSNVTVNNFLSVNQASLYWEEKDMFEKSLFQEFPL